MSQLSLQIVNKRGESLADIRNTGAVNLVYRAEYQAGDEIVLSTSQAGIYLILQLDDAMNPSFVYMKNTEYRFIIPFEEKRIAYNPKAFTTNIHLLRAREASENEIRAYKNLAHNEYDCHENSCCYPHAFANVETRGESVFMARNAIDGITENHSHGEWPYGSWGINQNPKAELTIEFGRLVEINKIVIFERCDFPHDNYWKHATLFFSDGSELGIPLVKSDAGQEIRFEAKRVCWVKLGNLIKDPDNSSVFPALTQIEVYGTEIFE